MPPRQITARVLALGLLFAATVTAAGSAQAQAPAANPAGNVSLAAADRMLDAAEQRAGELGAAQCFAVVDEGRNLVAFRRMDGARLNCIQIAQDKAYTAMTYSLDTRETLARAQDNLPFMLSILQQPHMYLAGGGQVIRVDGLVVGAIGISGGAAGQDDLVADTARAALAP
jgi:uncharacterized protein GlcG (DUF336 family)